MSVAPLASAVETKLIGMQKNIQKNDGDEISGWRDILTIASASVGGIVIIFGMVIKGKFAQIEVHCAKSS